MSLLGSKKEIILRLRFFAFDSDGVLFPNTVWEGVSVNDMAFKPKIRSYYDGQGISLLRALGFRICIITNEKGHDTNGVREAVERWNKLPSCQKSEKEGRWPKIDLFEGKGGTKKRETLLSWLAEQGGTFEECGAMGDDLVDAEMLRAVAFPTAPSSAEKAIRDICLYVSRRSGGEGAVRDLANHFVRVFGKNPLDLPYE